MHKLEVDPGIGVIVPDVAMSASFPEAVSESRNDLATYLFQGMATGLPLALSDGLVAFGLCFLIDFSVNAGVGSALHAALFAVQVLLLFACLRLYPGIGLNRVEEFRRLTLASLVGLLLSIGLDAIQNPLSVQLLLSALPWAVLAAAVPVTRFFSRSILSQFDWWCQPVMVAGSMDEVETISKRLQANRSLGLRPVGTVDAASHSVNRLRHVFGADRQRAHGGRARHESCFWVAAIPPRSNPSASFRDDHDLDFPHVLWVHAQEGRILPNNIRICTSEAEEMRRTTPLRSAGLAAKRALDFVAATAGGLLCLPLLALIAISIKLTSPGPIFYGTPRLGMRGSRYRMWKFRTMVPDAQARLQQYLAEHPEERTDFERFFKLRNDPRITPVGKWLRLLSLDELPQIWNVVCGDMSLIGPRPVDVGLGSKPKLGSGSANSDSNRSMPVIAGLYHEKALEVRPGITGLWQISGRADTTQYDRMDLDCEYVDNWSLWLDFYILLCTPAVVCRMEGAR